MTLFEIDQTLRSALDSFEIDEETGEVVGGFDPEYIKSLTLARDQKIEGIALYIKELRSESDALKAEYKKLKARSDSATKKAEHLKNYLDYMLGVMDMKGFATSRCLLKYRKSTSVEVDENVLPKEYMRIKYEPDKVSIRDALKAGKVIEGAKIVEKQNLQIE